MTLCVTLLTNVKMGQRGLEFQPREKQKCDFSSFPIGKKTKEENL